MTELGVPGAAYARNACSRRRDRRKTFLTGGLCWLETASGTWLQSQVQSRASVVSNVVPTHPALVCNSQRRIVESARGDNRGASAHQRWLALVSAQTSKTSENWRSPALTGASLRSFNPQAVGSIPTPVIHTARKPQRGSSPQVVGGESQRAALLSMKAPHGAFNASPTPVII